MWSTNITINILHKYKYFTLFFFTVITKQLQHNKINSSVQFFFFFFFSTTITQQTNNPINQ